MNSLQLVSIFYGLLTLSGGGTAVFGIWSFTQKDSSSNVLKKVDSTTIFTDWGSPALIGLGCVIALVGVLGFLGTLKKISWMLMVLFIFVFIIFILQVTVAIFIYLPDSVKEKPLKHLETKVLESIRTQYKEENKAFMTIWNEAMKKLKCCGYNNYSDFTVSEFVKINSTYPSPCCGESHQTHPHDALKCEKPQVEEKKVRGCIQVLLSENMPISGPLCFLIASVEIIVMVVSLKVYRFLNRLPGLPDPLGL